MRSPNEMSRFRSSRSKGCPLVLLLTFDHAHHDVVHAQRHAQSSDVVSYCGVLGAV
jgi:hypothetical protein